MEAATEERPRPFVSGLITAGLILSAVVYLGYHLAIATQADDAGHLETPLALAVAQQLRDGPATLYGPFSGENPLVLIHAPLYYRLGALLAWPIAKAGVDPVVAALASGRLLSILGLALLAWAASRIARLDGAPSRAGLWSALLILGAPLVSSQGVMVRPDVPALAFQTLGVALALRALHDGGPTRRLLVAYAAFALAFAMKQHAVGSAAVTSCLLIGGWLRGRLRLGPIVAGHALGLVVVSAYYGMEDWLTSGRLHVVAFGLPAQFREIAPASWRHALEVAVVATRRSAALPALGLAALVARPIRALGGRLDFTLALYTLAESALAAILCRGSSGSWVNYFMPTIVYASILVGRALSRVVVDRRVSTLRLTPIGLALAMTIGLGAYLVDQSAVNRAEALANVLGALARPSVASRPPAARYIVGSPNYNRLYGRVELAYDHWLYPLFEATDQAEPREVWLREALVGPVEVVLAPPTHPDEPPGTIPGLSEPLPALGYNLIGQAGPYSLWERTTVPRPAPDPEG